MALNKLKPRKNSRYKQGYVDPRSCKKYIPVGNPGEPIIYRSGLEYRFMQFCEDSAQIVSWSPEPLEIIYTSALDGKEHKYYPDYVIVSSTGERAVIEIKPLSQTQKPSEHSSAYEKEQWVRNCSKWKAAMEWCKDRGYKFMIVTENFFNKTS